MARTNIDLDDKLLEEALRCTGLKTKKDAVTAGLKVLVGLGRQKQLRKLRGKLRWQGDLALLRSN